MVRANEVILVMKYCKIVLFHFPYNIYILFFAYLFVW